jgi:hypothetical protein
LFVRSRQLQCGNCGDAQHEFILYQQDSKMC